MLAQLEVQEQEKPGRSALLLDDPAAELDGDNLSRLMQLVRKSTAQLWVTSLRPEIAEELGAHRMFHVKQGSVSR
jgi:recombinational DNA repair ATPase RecF